jgi:hypothetical protein
MLPILSAFSATRARTTRAPAGSCQSLESAFRRNCAFNSVGPGKISDYGRTRPQWRTVRSSYCKFEFESFQAREKELDRNNLIFPILYVPVPALTDDRWRQDPLLAIIGSRQYEQWQNLRHLDVSSSEVALRVEKFCANICRALEQEWLSPEQRRVAEARRAADAKRRRQQQAKIKQRALRSS